MQIYKKEEMNMSKKQPVNPRDDKVVDQLTIAKRIAQEMPEFNLSDIQKIVQREQELTMYSVSKGYKVVKKNYLTIYPIEVKGRKLVSPLNGESYDIPEHRSIGVKVGEGFKALVANRDMPSKICRSVAKQDA